MTSKQQAIQINGESVDIQGVQTVADLIEQQQLTTRRFVIVLNDEILPKSSWSDTQIHKGDQIDIMSPISGG